MFLAGLDSPNHSDESRRAWVALMWRDLKRAALAATETDKQAAAEELARALHLRLGHADTHPDFRGCSWCTPEAADILRAIEDIRKEASDGE
jgi:hypothetical protein